MEICKSIIIRRNNEKPTIAIRNIKLSLLNDVPLIKVIRKNNMPAFIFKDNIINKPCSVKQILNPNYLSRVNCKTINYNFPLV